MPSQPVVTEKWAGNFDCSTCRRKRLTADEFSKRALERHRKTGDALKCKQCVQDAEARERSAAAAAAAAAKVSKESTTASESADPPLGVPDEDRQCASCRVVLGRDRYNNNQWNKGPGKSRCRDCVDRAVADESKLASQAREAAIEEARKAVDAAHASGGNAMAILKAESVLAALEAEKVTGLKPQSMGGRGSNRGRGRGGRGRNRVQGGAIR